MDEDAAHYYRVFAAPTKADYETYVRQAGNAEPQGVALTYDQWIANQGKGKHLLKTSSKAEADALAKKVGGTVVKIRNRGRTQE